MARAGTGTRIRQHRLDRGMRQVDLAAALGISAAYLNLIEHGRRRIAGKLLADVARVLAVEPAVLTDGGGSALLDGLRALAAEDAQTEVEIDRAEELAARFPGWAALLLAEGRRNAALRREVRDLTDRLAHDPALAGSLHEVISAVTSIRATASILVSGDNVDRDWQERFQRNIHADSLRLAESSRALVAFLDAPGERSGEALSAIEQVDAYLAAADYRVAALEGAGSATPEDLAEGPAFTGTAARRRARAVLRRYRADALAMPAERFDVVARAEAYDPMRIAQVLGQPFAAVLARMATLPFTAGHVATGFAQADGAGAIGLAKPLGDLAVARGGAACALWPIFEALGQIGRPLRRRLVMPGEGGARLVAFAIAETQTPPSFDGPVPVEANMLYMPDPDPEGGAAVPIGPGCRICPRDGCAARREASILRGEAEL